MRMSHDPASLWKAAVVDRDLGAVRAALAAGASVGRARALARDHRWQHGTVDGRPCRVGDVARDVAARDGVLGVARHGGRIAAAAVR
jgi:hypothetical protein